jgi:SCY1-like protein 1
MTPKAFLQLGMGEKAGDGARFFADNHLVQVCAGLDQFAIGSDAEKAALLRHVLSRILSPDLPQITAHQVIEGLSCLFPPEFASNRVLPALISALDFGGSFSCIDSASRV